MPGSLIANRASIPLIDRADLGWSRLRAAFWPVIQAAVAAVLAYQVSLRVLGHQTPFFAAIAAWMCLGWSFDRDIRRVGEVAIGVTLGVALGDLVVRTIGSGWWQLGTVLVVSALLARLFDRGPLLTTQAGAQAIVIAGLPMLAGGPYSRALDAVVGSVVALAFVLLTPYDPRKPLWAAAGAGTAALATTARLLAHGVSQGDSALMAQALDAGRAVETEMEQGIAQAGEHRSRTRLTVNRKFRPEIADLEDKLVLAERAMRSLRVLARRLQYDSPAAPLADRLLLAEVLQEYAANTDDLGRRIVEHDSLNVPCAGYQALARQLNATITSLDYRPAQLPPMPSEKLGTRSQSAIDPGIRTGLSLMRAVIGDTMQVAGATEQEVLTVLPPRPVT